MTAPTPPSSAIPRIFVSHSHKDNDFGVKLVTALRAALGVADDDVWFDISGGAHGGDLLWQKVVTEITARPIFIVVVSPDAMDSPWVNNEITLAWTLKTTRHNRHVIPVVWRECEMRGDLQMLLYVSFLPPQTFEAGLASLVTAIHALAGTRPTLPPGTPDRTLPPLPAPPAVPADSQTAAVADLFPGIQEAYQCRDWHRLIDKADALLDEAPDATPASVYRMLGEARAETGDFARARASLDVALARTNPDAATLALVGRVCLQVGDASAADGYLKRALARVDAPAERLPLLRDYCAALIALTQWDELLRRTEEGTRLATDDPFWPRTRLRVLSVYHRDAESLALLRTLTARPDASSEDWVARARLVRAVDGETEVANGEITTALDAADRLAGPNNPRVAAMRRELFPPPPPPAPPLPAEQFPERLASLGFVPQKGRDPKTGKDAAYIVPPTVPVPAWSFMMGSNPKRDPDTQSDEPLHTVEVPAFTIARYPVTVAEYACFVRAGQQEPSGWQDQMRQKLDHPVTYVTWHDATAYAAWLAGLTGQSWRLPTEEEWEKAARWDPRTGASRLYPWGDTFDATRCNTRESGVGTTTPIGKYGAAGASPCRAEDMAGNVWEWTNSGRDSSTTNRVLRGGSWSYGHQDARAAYRILSRPDSILLVSSGFRLVVSVVRTGS